MFLEQLGKRCRHSCMDRGILGLIVLRNEEILMWGSWKIVQQPTKNAAEAHAEACEHAQQCLGQICFSLVSCPVAPSTHPSKKRCTTTERVISIGNNYRMYRILGGWEALLQPGVLRISRVLCWE